MKNRILTFIIGVLTGAIIMVLVFIIFNKTSENINNGNFPPNEKDKLGDLMAIWENHLKDQMETCKCHLGRLFA